MKLSVKKITLAELDLLMQWRMRVLDEVFSGEYAVLGSEKYNEVRGAVYQNNESYYKEHLSDDTHTACFATDEETGMIVGCGGICFQKEMPSPDNLAGTNGYLMNIYTLPEVRGRGVGRQIVEYLIADAKEKGTEKIYLESSGAGKHLYEEMGFSDMKDYMKLTL